MHTFHEESNKISLFQISMSVKTPQWLLDVSRTPNVVTCPHISCASVKLDSRAMERWNVEVNTSISGAENVLLSSEHSLTLCYR
jgi:hypothetical protein